MLKLLLIFVLCALSASLTKGQANKEEFAKNEKIFYEECLKESGATQSDLDELMNKKMVTTKPAQCLAACLMKKHKVMDDNGKFVKSAALEYAKVSHDGNENKSKKSAEIIEVCAGIPLPSDHCDAAKTLFDCFYKEGAARATS